MALADNLIAFWKLNETSGARYDSVGSNHLTDHNTVGYAAGKIGNCATFVNTASEWLSCANNSDLQTGDIDFTIALWVYLDETGSYLYIVSRRNIDDTYEYVIRLNGGNTILFRVYGASDATVGSVETGALSTGTWYCVVAWHDAINNQVGISVNNGTPTTAATTGAPTAKNVAFALGSVSNDGYYHHGGLDAVGFWKRVLTQADRTEYWNRGYGKEPPFSLVSFAYMG